MTLRTLLLLAILLLPCIEAIYAQQANFIAPHLIVYKTRANYDNKVPVTLSTDKKVIQGFPDPSDIRQVALPEKLHKGYLIDNRGINAHSAFLNMSYAAYSRRTQAPSIKTLYKNLLVKDPFTIICDCGERYHYKNPKAEINKMIDDGTLLKKCKIIYQAQR